jgi:hypothetical protein
MSTNLASSKPIIDSSDSDVTILATCLKDCFSSIQDHRSKRTLLHQLSDLLTIAVLSVIAVYLVIVLKLLKLFVSTGASKILCIGYSMLLSMRMQACVRSLHAPHNLDLVRRFALNVLNCEHTFKGSLTQKSKRAAMDNRYMLTLLASAFAPSTTTS